MDNPQYFTVKIDKNGEISAEAPNINTSAGNRTRYINNITYNEKEKIVEVTIENDKSLVTEDDVPSKEIPLLMDIEGKVFLDMPSGKQGDTNNIYDDGIDKLQEGIVVKLYEEDGVTPAQIANPKYLEETIQIINEEQGINLGTRRDLTRNTKIQALKDMVNFLNTYKPSPKALDDIIELYNKFYDLNITYEIKETSRNSNGSSITYMVYIYSDGELQSDVNVVYTRSYGTITYANGSTQDKSFYEEFNDEDIEIIQQAAYKFSQIFASAKNVYNNTSPNKILTRITQQEPSEEIASPTTLANLKYHLEQLKQQPNNTTVTDANGKFGFYGLRPDKKYIVEFWYNGLLYEDVEYSVTVGGTVSKDKITVSSKAIENAASRAAVTSRFSEIGSYPYNYNSPSKGSENRVFLPEEIVKLSNSELINIYNGGTSGDIDKDYFIRDSFVTARTNPIGNILEAVENNVKISNGIIDSNTRNMVYPIVKLTTIDASSYINGEITEYKIKALAQKLKNESDSILGYYIEQNTVYNVQTVTVSGHDDGHKKSITEGKSTIVDKKIVNYKTNTENILESSLYYYNNPRSTCSRPTAWDSRTGKVTATCGVEMYHETTYTKDETKKPTYTLQVFEIADGFSKEVKNNILYGKFESGESYFTSDGTLSGYYDGYINWSGASLPQYTNVGLYNIFSNHISTTYGWGKNPSRTKATICEELLNGLEEANKSEGLRYTNFGIKFRPIMDLGLINDVERAEVTINHQTENYIYNKRAANGTSFRFGVNEVDIGEDRITNAEESNYYDTKTKLANKQDPNNSNNVSLEDQTNYLRDYDIDYSSLGQIEEGVGEVSTGGYKEYPVSIKLRYRISLYNQARTTATITEIVDYYNPDFNLVGAFSKDGTRLPTSTISKYHGNTSQVAGLRKMYIPVDMVLQSGESNYIYVELEMNFTNYNPNQALLQGLRAGGYNIYNYAEINGYKTAEGYLDIDSIPGNMTGGEQKEDDESKSPALIFKNPTEALRSIAGTVFEDGGTNTSRVGNGIYDGDTAIKGAKVELHEVMSNGETDTLRGIAFTDDNGNYKFNKIVAGNYIVRFTYGSDDKTVLITKNGGQNEKSYNGESFENTIRNENTSGNNYWYINKTPRYSDATDDNTRRQVVISNFTNLDNHLSEVVHSWEDTKINRNLVDELIEKGTMFAETSVMTLDVENVENHANKTVTVGTDGRYNFEYQIQNIDFGIVERARAKLTLEKTIKAIKITDSSGRTITEGTAEKMQAGEVKYVKMVPTANEIKGFADIEIDPEIISGALLQITYEVKLKNNSETGNNIGNIKIVDYVSNNLNYDETLGNNASSWKGITLEELKNSNYVNKTAIEAQEETEKIDLNTYQTLLVADIAETLAPGEERKIELVLEKNLSSDEESDWEYENQAEIVYSRNTYGRGDYSSIYGNLDPTTNTSRQGDLYWDPVENPVDANGKQAPSIRKAEPDSGYAEEVTVTAPTGASWIVLEPMHYILISTCLLTLIGAIYLSKKYLIRG